MPCYTIKTTRLDLKKASPETLLKTLQSLGMTATLENGVLVAYGDDNTTVRWTATEGMTIRSSQGAEVGEKIMTAYAQTNTRIVAQRYGWQVGKQVDNKLQLIRR